MVTVREALENAVSLLGEREYTNPSLDSMLLLSYVLEKDKTYIYLNLDKDISEDELERFYHIVRIRAKGYPLQYILKTQEFMGLEFYVEEGVLIPRPDTEILVEKIIDICKERYSERDRVRILEIGSGSGAIAVSLAHYIENAKVYSVDIDETPLSVAKRNADMNGVNSRVSFILGDVFEPLKNLDCREFDIIVSNPPYIKRAEIESLQLEVSTFEPKLALDGGEDGLYFYRKITEESGEHLAKGGLLAFEIGYDQAKDVEIMMKSKYKDIEIIKDYGGNDRVIIGYKKE
jgi:release factor glutamine methyltransferase